MRGKGNSPFCLQYPGGRGRESRGGELHRHTSSCLWAMLNACFESLIKHLHCVVIVRQILITDFIYLVVLLLGENIFCWCCYQPLSWQSDSILFYFKEMTRFLCVHVYVRITASILRIFLNFVVKRKKAGAWKKN